MEIVKANQARENLNSFRTSLLVVILARIDFSIFIGQANLHHHQCILLILCSVCAQHHVVLTVVLIGHPAEQTSSAHWRLWQAGQQHLRVFRGEPVDCKAWPVQGVAHHNVIQEGSILLPNFVLLVHNRLMVLLSCTRECMQD